MLGPSSPMTTTEITAIVGDQATPKSTTGASRAFTVQSASQTNSKRAFRDDLNYALQQSIVSQHQQLQLSKRVERDMAATEANRGDHRAMLRVLVSEAYRQAVDITLADRYAKPPDERFLIKPQFVKQLLESIDRAVEISIRRNCDVYNVTLSKLAEMHLFDSRSTVPTEVARCHAVA